MIERIAVSLGLLAAFSMIVRERILADGAGERSACMRASSEANVSAWVKGTGRTSLMARLHSIVGSC